MKERNVFAEADKTNQLKSLVDENKTNFNQNVTVRPQLKGNIRRAIKRKFYRPDTLRPPQFVQFCFLIRERDVSREKEENSVLYIRGDINFLKERELKHRAPGLFFWRRPRATP